MQGMISRVISEAMTEKHFKRELFSDVLNYVPPDSKGEAVHIGVHIRPPSNFFKFWNYKLRLGSTGFQAYLLAFS